MTFGERFRKVRRRMRADADKGSAAIEFAMVAPVFFVLLLGIFEAAIMFFSQAVLQNAMTDMGRYVRTGQAACHTKNAAGACTAAMTQAQFRTEVCAKVAPLIPCNGNLQIDVKKSTTGFGGATHSSPLTAGGALNTAMNGYDTGAACDVVLARAFYTWPVATPVLSWFLVNMAGNKHLVTAATAFRNEPFVNGVAGC
jgi:Flp pilus assembly protein TadG